MRISDGIIRKEALARPANRLIPSHSSNTRIIKQVINESAREVWVLPNLTHPLNTIKTLEWHHPIRR